MEEKNLNQETVNSNQERVAAVATTNVSGKITTNTYWSLSNSPYVVSGTVEIAAGVSLTIAPGVTVQMSTSSNGAFNVQGELSADRVTFTSVENATGSSYERYWRGFTVGSKATLNLLQCNIRYVSYAAISNYGTLYFRNSSITNAQSDGIYIVVTDATKVNEVVISNSTISAKSTGVNIASLKNASFVFTGNSISGTKSVTMALSAYLPISATGGLDSNTLTGDIDLSGELKSDLSLSARHYLISNNLTVAAGANLTIASGAVLKATNSSYSTLYVYGSMQATGVTFTTSTDPGVGGTGTMRKWSGLYVAYSGSLTLDRSEIRYTSSAGISNSGTLRLTNSTITNPSSYGLYMSTAKDAIIENNTINGSQSTSIYFAGFTGNQLVFRNNTVTNSKYDSIYINLTLFKPVSMTGGLDSNSYDSKINLEGTLQTDLSLSRGMYSFSRDVTVPEGKTLSIASGSTIVLTNYSYSSIQVNGTLNANGVTFTGSGDPIFGSQTPTYWQGIKVGNKGTLNMDNGEIRYLSSYAVNSYGTLKLTNSVIKFSKSSGVYINAVNVDVTMENNIIDTCESYGIYLSTATGGKFTFQNNIVKNSKLDSLYVVLTTFNPASIIGGIDNNTLNNGIRMYGTLMFDLSLSERIYHVENDMTVSAGKALTFAPGSKIISTNSSRSTIKIDGVLNALGTAAKPILFTTTGDPEMGGSTVSYWNGLSVTKTGALNIDYCKIRYASSQAVEALGALRLTNSVIANSKTYGVRINSSAENVDIQIESNEFTNHARSGLYVIAMKNGKFTFKNNIFLNCATECVSFHFTNFQPSEMDGRLEANSINGPVELTGITQIDFSLPKNTYQLNGNLTVGEGKKLTTVPGAIFKEMTTSSASSSNLSGLIVNGSFEAVGTEQEPILFTSKNDPLFGPSTLYYWKGIEIGEKGNAKLHYADVRYTGSKAIEIKGGISLTKSLIQKSQGYGLIVNSQNRDVLIEDNKILENQLAGIYIASMQNGYFTFQNNEIAKPLLTTSKSSIIWQFDYYQPLELIGGLEKNTYEDPVNIYGNLTEKFVLPKGTYHVTYPVRIVTGATLRFSAGSTVKIFSVGIEVDGTLDVEGSENDKILLTGENDPKTNDGSSKASLWRGITINPIGICLINNAVIRNAGKTGTTPPSYPIYCYGYLDLKNTEIADTGNGAIQFVTRKQPVLKNITFTNILGMAMYSSYYGDFTIKAPNLYWNSADGPNVNYGTPTDGLSIGYGIDYLPFINNNQPSATLHAQISYPFDTIMRKTAATIFLQGGSQGLYYVELMCSRDNKNWVKKGNALIMLSGGKGSAEIGFELYESGTLYTKGIIFDSQGGNKLMETRMLTTPIEVWYEFSTDQTDKLSSEDLKFAQTANRDMNTHTYILANTYGAPTNPLKCISRDWFNSLWKEYSYTHPNWTATNVSKRVNPVMDLPRFHNLKLLRTIDVKPEDLKLTLNQSKFEYISQGEKYIANKDIWGKKILSSDFTDNMSQLPGMLIDWQPIEFTYENQKYMISIWKGQYYLHNGCEIALYKETDGYYSPYTLDGMHIKCTLLKQNLPIVEHEADASSLTTLRVGESERMLIALNGVIKFPNADMAKAFGIALTAQIISVVINEETVTFTFISTKYRQPSEPVRESDTVWRAVLKGLMNELLFTLGKEIPEDEKDIEYPYDPSYYALKLGKTVARIRKVPETSLSVQKQLYLDYYLDLRNKWIYCNYPEQFDENIFVNAGNEIRCINRVTVNKGIGKVFYSFQGEKLKSDYYIGVCVTTNKTTPVQFRTLNYGHLDNGNKRGWFTVAVDSWRQYYDEKSDVVYEVTKDKPVWINTEKAPMGMIVSGNLRFLTDDTVTVAVYAFTTPRESITGNEPLYPYDYIKGGTYTEAQLTPYKVYSGYGDGHEMKANRLHIKVSELNDGQVPYFVTNSRESKTYFNTVNQEAGSNDLNEMIPITITDTRTSGGMPYVAKNGGTSPLHNVANWATEYFIPVTFENDTDHLNPVIEYIPDCAPYNVPDRQIEPKDCEDKFLIIRQLENKENLFYHLSYQKPVPDGEAGKNVTQNALLPSARKTIEFKGKKKVDFDFIYILGTNSTGAVKHTFKLKQDK